MDIIYKYQEKYAHQMLKEYGPLPNLAPVEQKYFLNIRIGFILSIILTWVKSGRQETTSQLEKIVERQLEYLQTSFKAKKASQYQGYWEAKTIYRYGCLHLLVEAFFVLPINLRLVIAVIPVKTS